MNFSISGIGVNTKVAHPFKMTGTNDLTAGKVQGQGKNEEKKDKQNSTGAVLSISNSSSSDRSKAITTRFQKMKETMQKQIQSLNERLQKASEQGNTELEEQLTESIKELNNDFTALDEQLNAALFEEQQRKAEEAKKKEEEDSKKKEKEQEKFKTEDEQIKKEERKSFEFFAKTDMVKESIQGSKITKAKMERTKGRIEGELSADAAAKADREQRQRARASELANGFSYVPYVSGKSIITEKKRIASGGLSPDEFASVGELNKLSIGIENMENSISRTIARLNKSANERTEDANDSVTVKQKSEAEHRRLLDDGAEGNENTDAEEEKSAGLKDTEKPGI